MQNELVEKILERFICADGRCPNFECWQHSSKDCGCCEEIEIKLKDAIKIVQEVAAELVPDINVGDNDQKENSEWKDAIMRKFMKVE